MADPRLLKEQGFSGAVDAAWPQRPGGATTPPDADVPAVARMLPAEYGTPVMALGTSPGAELMGGFPRVCVRTGDVMAGVLSSAVAVAVAAWLEAITGPVRDNEAHIGKLISSTAIGSIGLSWALTGASRRGCAGRWDPRQPVRRGAAKAGMRRDSREPTAARG